MFRHVYIFIHHYSHVVFDANLTINFLNRTSMWIKSNDSVFIKVSKSVIQKDTLLKGQDFILRKNV